MKNQKFVLIIGNIVTKRIEKDGMNRRIVAIDDILSEYGKIYIENLQDKNKGIIRYWGRCLTNSFHRWMKNPKRFYNDNVDSYKAVSETSLHKLFSEASCIYIHSLYSAMKFPLEYLQEYSYKMVLDAHGCVVEEMEFGKSDSEKIKKAKLYEETLFPKLKALVCVSQNMIDFYKSKYQMENVQFIKLPIFTMHEFGLPKMCENQRIKNIVYSGGTNKWQNVDEMIEVIKKLPSEYNIKIISPDINYFTKYLKNYSNVSVKSVAPEEVQAEYNDCDYGFILRDDIVVNHVACPTKLIEYMAANLIPVVTFAGIGDFERLGYKYITIENLLEAKLPSIEEETAMRSENIRILENLTNDCEIAKNELKSLVDGFVKVDTV